jgi:DNA polymerase-4
MPSSIAYRKCPSIIFVKPRFDRYKEISEQIRAIFKRYTDLIEPLSLDEAYLDVTDNKINHYSAIYIAQLIRKDIYQETGLTASAGVSINKFIAKVASDINKPNGIKVILPEEVSDFMDQLPIKKFFGVGKATAEKLKAFEIHVGKDLRKHSMIALVQKFGKLGRYLHQVIKGEDHRPVKPNRVRKSFSSETTFNEDLTAVEKIELASHELCKKLHASMSKREITGKTVNVKIRFSDFSTYSKSKTFTDYMDDLNILKRTVFDLIMEVWDKESGIRLIGVGFSKLNTETDSEQLQLPF